MAVSQIPNLPSVIALNGTEQIEAVQAGVSVRVSVSQIASFANQNRSSGIVTYTTNFTVAAADEYITVDGSAQVTATLPTPATNEGRVLTIKNVANFAVVSVSANVVPLEGGSAGAAILEAAEGSWVTLVSDGTNWVTMKSNQTVSGSNLLLWG